MEVAWSDPSVQAAAIQCVGTVVASALAALTAAIVGKRFADQKYLKERLVLSQKDIAFLLAVEEAHCRNNVQVSGESLKLKMREAARNRGHGWSGKFTPSRAQARLSRLGLDPALSNASA